MIENILISSSLIFSIRRHLNISLLSNSIILWIKIISQSLWCLIWFHWIENLGVIVFIFLNNYFIVDCFNCVELNCSTWRWLLVYLIFADLRIGGRLALFFFFLFQNFVQFCEELELLCCQPCHFIEFFLDVVIFIFLNFLLLSFHFIHFPALISLGFFERIWLWNELDFLFDVGIEF